MIHFAAHDEHDSVGVVVVEGVKFGQQVTANEALGHRDFVLTRLYESA